MGARDEILGSIRKGLNVGADDKTRQETVAKRLSAHAPHLIPARGVASDDAVDRFCAEAERVQATTARVDRAADVPGAVASYLAGLNLPAKVKLTPDPLIQGAGWDKAATLQVETGVGDGADTAGVSRAFAGVAETGTLVFTSGPDNPTTVNFLPITHIAVIQASDIVGAYEKAWAKLREVRQDVDGKGRFMPRTVNWITGPSRTADIELTLYLGAHGPKNLHILIVDEDHA